jgi:DNA polymerase III delta prime subunit
MASPYSTAQNTATAHRPQTFKDVIGQETPKAALKAIAKAPATSFHSILLAGPFGTGKCVSGDTHIQTPNGIRQIRSLFPALKAEGMKYVPPTPLSLHFGKTTLPVSYLYYSGIKPTIKITTAAGKSVIGSLHHPVLTLNTDTGKVSYTQLSKITVHHHIIGVVTNTPPPFPPFPSYEFRYLPYPLCMTYDEFISGSYEKQMGYVAFLVKEERSLTLKTSHLLYAQAIAAVAALMGCYSRIKKVPPYSLGGIESYRVNLIPLMKNSILSQLVDPVLCPYSQKLARSCKGEAQKISEYLLDEKSAVVLRRTRRSALFADQVVSVELVDSIPLYDLTVPKVHAFIGDGYINHNTTLAKIFAKAVNCSKRNGDACGECIQCITHSNPYEYDSSVIGRIEAVRSLREDLRSKHIGGYRTVIFDEAQSCSREAQSALLALVEEPPQDTFIIFCTTDADALSEPLQSRCLRLDLNLMSSQQIKERIDYITKIKGKVLSGDVIRSIISKSRGHVRTCDNLLDMILLDEVESVHTLKTTVPTFFSMLVASSQGDYTKFTDYLNQTLQVPLATLRDDYFSFLEQLSEHFLRATPQISHLRKAIPVWLRISLSPICTNSFTDERLMMAFFRFLYHNTAPPTDETNKDRK